MNKEASAPSLGRNPEIELFRFFAALAVMLFHMGVCRGGMMAVDFFFILSGALMTRSLIFSKRTHLQAGDGWSAGLSAFIYRKVASFFPELIISVMIGLMISLYHDTLSGFLHKMLYSFINEICLLRMTGILHNAWGGVCPPSWYLSSLVIVTIILFPIIKFVKNPILLFTAGMLICGYLVHKAGGLEEHPFSDWYAVTYSGNIRALGEVLIGAASYYAAEHIKNNRNKRDMQFVITVAKYCGMVGALILFHQRCRFLEPIIILCSVVFISCCFSEKSWSVQGGKWNDCCAFLGKISLPLYLVHWPIVDLYERLKTYEVFQETSMPWIVCLFVLILFIITVRYCASFIRKGAAKYLA